MNEKKDLLSYVLVYSGPKDDKKLRFLATDNGAGMQVARHAVVAIGDGWAEKACEILKDVVDPDTLDGLRRYADSILGILTEKRSGSLWVSPHAYRLLSPAGLQPLD